MFKFNAPLPEPMQIAIRAHVHIAKHEADKPHEKRRTKKAASKKKPRMALILDCETTTTETQNLRFGNYQIRKNGILSEKGFFYDPAFLNGDELELLSAYARENDFLLMEIQEFRKLFLRVGYNCRAAIIGFNLPFDLSQISLNYSTAKSLENAFSLRLSEIERETRIQIKHLSSRNSIIRFTTRPKQEQSGFQQKKKMAFEGYSGCFIDVRTLASALKGKPFNLEKLCDLLKIKNPKHKNDHHGEKLTREYIDYAVNDVQATWECFEALNKEYDALKLSLPVNKVYSEASLGKGYFKEMNIRPWHETQPDFPPELTTIIMSTYYGGRSEVHIRHEVVPVMYSDFRSMYPSVCTLMNLWGFIISDGITYADTTEKTQKFLDKVGINDLKKKAAWEKLHTLVCILPAADIVPVRAPYAKRQGDNTYTIGVNHLSAGKPIWYTLADCIASKLLTGKAPKIVRALTFSPRNIQVDLKSIAIQGKEDFRIDPAKDDFFKSLILRRGVVQASMYEGNPQNDLLKAEEKNIKLIANSTSYGIFMQLDQERLEDFDEAYYFDIEGQKETIRTEFYEKAGPCFHPLLGTLITGAARLMLALAECLGQQAGLEWAFCDTDSMAFANYRGLTPEVFAEKVKGIITWFSTLDPYGDGAPLLKLENHEEGKPLYCWAISAKRYALFNIEPDNTPIIRKASMHGLGQYLDPYDDGYIRSGSRITKEQIKETGLRRWQLDIWHNILVHALNGNDIHFNPAEADEFKIPAACRYAATSPNIMRWLDGYNKPNGVSKPIHAQIRPSGFILAYCLNSDDEKYVWDFAGQDMSNRKSRSPRILSPFSKNVQEAVKHCFDCNAPEDQRAPIDIRRLKTLQEALADYNIRPESKFLNGRPYDKGLTQRRHIDLSAVHYIGKEANLYDEQTYLGSIPDAQVVYGLGKTQAEAMLKEVCSAAAKYGALRFAKATGRTRQHIQDTIKGRTKPSGTMLLELHEAIKTVEAVFADEIAVEKSALSKACKLIEAGATTIKDLAEAIKCDASYLAKILSGKRSISGVISKNILGLPKKIEEAG